MGVWVGVCVGGLFLNARAHVCWGSSRAHTQSRGALDAHTTTTTRHPPPRTKHNKQVKCHACVGGTSVREDARILSSGVHVVVGTPGRGYDMLRRRCLRADSIKMFVLDEADEMLSRGFKDQIYDIFQVGVGGWVWWGVWVCGGGCFGGREPCFCCCCAQPSATHPTILNPRTPNTHTHTQTTKKTAAAAEAAGRRV